MMNHFWIYIFSPTEYISRNCLFCFKVDVKIYQVLLKKKVVHPIVKL